MGRAQRAFLPADKQTQVRNLMLEAAPWINAILPDSTPDKTLLNAMTGISHFGCVPCMKYEGVEFNALGTLRFVCEGTRTVRAFNFKDFMAYTGCSKSLQEIKGRLRNMLEKDMEGMQSHSNTSFMVFEQFQGAISYIPSGWFVTETGCAEKIVGIRTAAVITNCFDLLKEFKGAVDLQEGTGSILKGLSGHFKV